jgi:nuclear protein localization family protein 4
MALEKSGVFVDSEKRKMMQIRQPKEGEEPVPSVLYKGTAVTEFEPEFLLVNIAHGRPSHKRFNILKNHDFP